MECYRTYYLFILSFHKYLLTLTMCGHYSRSWDSVMNNKNNKISFLTEFTFLWIACCPCNINWYSSYTFPHKENTHGRIYFSNMAPTLSPTQHVLNTIWLWRSFRTWGLVGWPIHPGLPRIFLVLAWKVLCSRKPLSPRKDTLDLGTWNLSSPPLI